MVLEMLAVLKPADLLFCLEDMCAFMSGVLPIKTVAGRSNCFQHQVSVHKFLFLLQSWARTVGLKLSDVALSGELGLKR